MNFTKGILLDALGYAKHRRRAGIMGKPWMPERLLMIGDRSCNFKIDVGRNGREMRERWDIREY